MFGKRAKALQALASERDELLKRTAYLEHANATQERQAQQMLADLQRLGALDHRERANQLDQLRAAIESERSQFERQRADHQQALTAQFSDHQQRVAAVQAEHDATISRLKSEIEALSATVVPFTEEAVFQDAGIFRYHHRLQSAEAYKERLSEIQDDMKSMVSSGTAVESSTSFTYNNSVAQGRKLAKDLSKLMLRAYNAEAENCLRVMRAGSVEVAKKRLEKTAVAIEKLGKLIDIRISSRYRQLRAQELELTADYLWKKEEEKEAAREERVMLREQAKVEAEIRREIERLEKEREHRLNVMAALMDQGKNADAERQRKHVEELEASIEGMHKRDANVRAGYIYVISNIGTFGPGVVKIGLTRRLDPRERVAELGDASVPFRYDTHVLFFSADAVSIENALHRELASRRVNQINLRREFFYATPDEVRWLLKKHAGDVLEFNEEPEAAEYRLSKSARDAAGPLAMASTSS